MKWYENLRNIMFRRSGDEVYLQLIKGDYTFTLNALDIVEDLVHMCIIKQGREYYRQSFNEFCKSKSDWIAAGLLKYGEKVPIKRYIVKILERRELTAADLFDETDENTLKIDENAVREFWKDCELIITER